MSRRERRTARRYVIDGLLFEIAGVVHETIDVSAASVAVVRQPGVDYANLKPPFRFTLSKKTRIDQPVSKVGVLHERTATVVLGYACARQNWERTLKHNDILADAAALEDVFE